MSVTLSHVKDALSIYCHKRVLILLLLGFSAGLPLMLVFSTLSFWLREAGIDRTAIGYFSWIALAYAIKWAWSPLVDRLSLPFFTRLLGRRRGWMLFAQLILVIAILGMSQSDPVQDLERLALFALMVAFASATQDIVIDAFRIDSAPIKMQAALAAAYQVGYRSAMIVATAGALTIAAWVGPSSQVYDLASWQTAYLVMAALMSVGIITTLMSKEPQVETKDADAKEAELKIALAKHHHRVVAAALSWIYTASILPFIDFFKRYGYSAFLILLLISCYRISDIVMGIMANVFYVDMGFSKAEIAAISKVYGLIMTLVGAGAGGVLLARYGTMKILFLGALMVALTNLLFAYQAMVGYDVNLLTAVISIDNFSAGIATAAFIAYLSSLTSSGYSATQYALLSSIMLLFPKFIAGFSGAYIDAFGYINFFVAASVIGFPVLGLIVLVQKFAPHPSDDLSAAQASAEQTSVAPKTEP
ncbi:AmpG family muropeptide MFS transporter [Shewanella algidipiscicola]|uniref:MFS transporter n=1 Tax=Shewanella algidipiscicola TaxID=614070 RepID=A0ABQ4PIC7_9GAMM|nr:MFS transporter [Shewanella algidipiscicola]GIU47184.1 MFS transporter [Shewanella algidipiscicola]